VNSVSADAEMQKKTLSSTHSVMGPMPSALHA
jgi:hypothetical protein